MRISHILSVDPEGTRFKPKTHMPVPRTSNGETTHSRSNVECCCATSAKRRAEGLRRQAARPKMEASEETTQRTDVQKRSGAVHGRSVARWYTPRPTGLGLCHLATDLLWMALDHFWRSVLRVVSSDADSLGRAAQGRPGGLPLEPFSPPFRRRCRSTLHIASRMGGFPI